MAPLETVADVRLRLALIVDLLQLTATTATHDAADVTKVGSSVDLAAQLLEDAAERLELLTRGSEAAE